MTDLEDEVKGFTTKMDSKVNLILQSLNIATQGQIVTPTKNDQSTNGTASQMEMDSEDPNRSLEDG